MKKNEREKQNDLSHVRQSVESIDIEVQILEATKIFFLLQTCGTSFQLFPLLRNCILYKSCASSKK